LFSKVLNEERSFLISLPKGYNDSMKKFPVLYRLDGDAEQLYDMYQKIEDMVFKQQAPEMILVSIKNTDRRRDMTPVKTGYCENPGADKFLKFISSELMPFIDKNYRTSNFRILCGQSQSSVFTMYTLLEQPQLFNGYIAISAYFPGCRDYFIEKAKNSFGHKSFKDRYFFFTRGAQDDQYNRNGITEKALAKLIKIIKNTNPSGFCYEYKVYPEFGHCPEPSLVDGLNWLKKAVSSDLEYLFNSTHPYTSPDESYIVFDVFDNNGISALYVSLERKHWNEGIKLDPEVNTTRLRRSSKCPSI
jgi:predicted alpha/beta superfamily hydrolase